MRLRNYAENNQIIPTSQHGFRQNRSTGTYIAELLCAIQNGKRCKLSIAGIFIDLQKAFDSVWNDGLLYKLSTLGASGRFLGTIKSFINSRQLKIHVNNYTTQPLKCNIGVPQGSVISPLLFTIFISDMITNCPGLKLQFADDTTILILEENDTQLTKQSQTACDIVHKWLNKWRLQANPTKSDFIVFSGEANTPKLGNKAINKANEGKVLGLTIDSKLSFKTQIQSSKYSLTRKWSMLKPYIYGGLNICTARKIILTVILPKAAYLAHIWDTSKCLSIYNMLKDTLHVPFQPPSECLHVFASIPPLNILYLRSRLKLVKQILTIRGTANQYPRSMLTQILLAETRKFLDSRTASIDDKILRYLTNNKIYTHTQNIWKISWVNFCKRYNSAESLINFIPDPSVLITTAKIPSKHDAKLTGKLCALISGHAKLQVHLYHLGLTFTPLCVCRGGDETPYHFLFECKQHSLTRLLVKPHLPNWLSIMQYIKLSEATKY